MTTAALCNFPAGIPALGKVWALPGRHRLCRCCLLVLFSLNQAESYGRQIPSSLTTHRKPQKGSSRTSEQRQPCVGLLPKKARPNMGEMLPHHPCSSPCPHRHRRRGPGGGSHLGVSWRAPAETERGWTPHSQKGATGKVEQASSHLYFS